MLTRNFMANPDAKIFLRSHRRCGVACLNEKCGWRGYRVIRFDLNLDQRLDVAEATRIIKGSPSHSCPRCRKSAVFTHVAGQI